MFCTNYLCFLTISVLFCIYAMARTKASVGAKISSGKSSKALCLVAPRSSSGGSGSSERTSRSAGGGNSVCSRETPKWQRPINTFFINKDNRGSDDGAGPSDMPAPKKIRNVIETDDEDENPVNVETKDQNGDTTEKNEDTSEQNGDITEQTDNLSKNVEKSPKVNQILDETIELEALVGENSHKIEEYYTKTNKGKGKGKKSNKNKENVVSNRRVSLKRDLDETEEPISKRAKVN